MNTLQRGNALMGIIGLLVGVWIVGASITGLYNNYAQKQQCIQDEGWVKGWLWCSTEMRNTFLFNMFRGLTWPLELLGASSATDQQITPQSKITQEQFDRSHTSTAYICWAIAQRAKRVAEAETLSRLITWTKKADPALATLHNDYMFMAAQEVIRIEKSSGLENYYREFCIKPIENVKQAIQQGMIK